LLAFHGHGLKVNHDGVTDIINIVDISPKYEFRSIGVS
jgi:hypothetical protein